MASTIDSAYIVLNDLCPGFFLYGHKPTGGFTGSTHHNVTETARVYAPGTKMIVPNTTYKGFSTFTYLQYGVTGDTCAAKAICVPDSTATAKWYQVCNTPANDIVNMYCAVALSAMTADYYGWFWTGGPCPENEVSALDGNFVTQGSVIAGGFSVGDSGSGTLLGFIVTASAVSTMGFSLAADA